VTRDLSEFHQRVGNLFQEPRGTAEWAELRLRTEQVDHYAEQGYVAGIRLFSDAQVDTLCEELEGLMDPSSPGHELFYEFHSNESPDPSSVLFHALGGWRIAPGFHDALWNPAFTAAAHQLLDGSVRFWHDQLFCKPARHGGVVAWHQDYSYWTRTKPMAHLTCWIALDDATSENGCLQYIPRSHRWPLLPITGLAGDMEAIQTVLTAEQKLEFRPIPIELARGMATFHHPLLVHGSYGNRSPGPRRALVLNVFRDGVRSDADTPLLVGVPPIPAGEPMGGRFFPLLFAGDGGGVPS
jgi:hypothetical protein